MGFSLSDLGHYVNPFDKSNVITGKGGLFDEAGRAIDDKLLGGDAADAALDAAAVQAEAGQQASALLDPFAEIGQQGLNQAAFLTDPIAQFDFLQSNPLFQMGLDNLNNQTRRSAAAGGRLSGDDTKMQFNNNALLAASPLINQQSNAIGGLLDYGLTTAGNQGNLLTGSAAATAGGIVGAQNARTQGFNNMSNLAGQGIGTYFSDERLKTNIEFTGTENGHNTYTWRWNDTAYDKFGLTGNSSGVIAQEVENTNTEAVATEDGYKKVNYEMIGVKHD